MSPGHRTFPEQLGTWALMLLTGTLGKESLHTKASSSVSLIQMRKKSGKTWSYLFPPGTSEDVPLKRVFLGSKSAGDSQSEQPGNANTRVSGAGFVWWLRRVSSAWAECNLQPPWWWLTRVNPGSPTVGTGTSKTTFRGTSFKGKQSKAPYPALSGANIFLRMAQRSGPVWLWEPLSQSVGREDPRTLKNKVGPLIGTLTKECSAWTSDHPACWESGERDCTFKFKGSGTELGGWSGGCLLSQGQQWSYRTEAARRGPVPG